MRECHLFRTNARLELNLRECLEETIHKLCILNIYPFPEFSDRTSRTLLSRATPQPQPLLTRIYDAAWPRARLMRQTYVCTRMRAYEQRIWCRSRICRSGLEAIPYFWSYARKAIRSVGTKDFDCINGTM